VIHPPACARYQKALRFCKRLRADVLAYAASVADGQAVTAALLTTVDRMAGAELARNAGALANQARHAGRLRTQLAAQYAAQRRAGRAISQLLSGAHFSASISATQAHAGLAGVLSKLGGGRHGTSRRVDRSRTWLRRLTVVHRREPIGPSDAVTGARAPDESRQRRLRLGTRALRPGEARALASLPVAIGFRRPLRKSRT
jgi:hypothetical protein